MPFKANYHTHTTRCGHAVGSDESYLLSAIKAGYTEIGFSDHTPWPYASGYRATMRMQPKELEGYVQSVRKLKEKYQDKITVRLALECEYFPDYMNWLKDTARRYEMDYLILGNHFYPSDEVCGYFGEGQKSVRKLSLYAEGCALGLETGLFSYLAHPDIFMRGQKEFGENERSLSREICRMANKAKVALGYNLAGALVAQKTGRPGYPDRRFWEIAAREGCTALVEADAHDNKNLEDDTLEKEGRRMLKELSIPVVEKIPMLCWEKGKESWT